MHTCPSERCVRCFPDQQGPWRGDTTTNPLSTSLGVVFTHPNRISFQRFSRPDRVLPIRDLTRGFCLSFIGVILHLYHEQGDSALVQLRDGLLEVSLRTSGQSHSLAVRGLFDDGQWHQVRFTRTTREVGNPCALDERSDFDDFNDECNNH